MVFPANAIQTCLTMKVLFGMALRPTTGFVKSLLRLIDLDGAVPNLSTPSRRHEDPEGQHRGSQGPLHLLIDRTGIKVEGEAPRPVDLPVDGAASLKAAVIPVILHYSTADPLA